MEMKAGDTVLFQLANGSRGKGKAGFFGGSFIHLSLSSYDKGQALTKAEVRSGSVTSSWPVRPSQPLVWRLPTVYQPAEHLSAEMREVGGGDWHQAQKSCSFRGNCADFTGALHTKEWCHWCWCTLIKRNERPLPASLRIIFLICAPATKSPSTTCQILQGKIAPD